MKRNVLPLWIAVVGTIAAAPVLAQEQASVNTPEKRAQEAAKHGPDALRRFVERTRMIYGVDIAEVYKSLEQQQRR